MNATDAKVWLFACGMAFAVAGLPAGPVRVTVDLNAVRAEVPRTLYGTGMEDVNHEIYGGLDAQRLWDESFEETEPPKAIPSRPKGTHHIVLGRQWTDLVSDGGVICQDAEVFHWGRRSQLLMPHGGVAGVANRGLNGWGVPCREGRRMCGRLFVRGSVGKLVVSLERQDGRIVYAQTPLAVDAGAEWRLVDFMLVPDRTDAAARFAIRASGDGKVWIDDAYLADEPTNEFGRMGCREDVVEGFRREGLTFLRWGGSMANEWEYLWKNFKDGERRPYAGLWFPISSAGFSYVKFVEMADRMKLPCAFSVSPHESVEDAAEIARWLKRFSVPICVQIGNEECTGWCASSTKGGIEGCRYYGEKLRRIVTAMRRENPALTFASAVMFQHNHLDWMEEAFRQTDGFADYWDLHVSAEHSGVSARNGARRTIEAFRAIIAKVNPKSLMRAVIFEENGYDHNQRRALAHAGILEAAREAGSFLLTSCPANALQPYMQNDNGWDQGQIFFTPDKVWMQPCGWAQQMASANHRDLLVAGHVEGCADVTVSATRDREGRSAVLHLVNFLESQMPIAFDFMGLKGLVPSKVTSLDAPCLTDRNPPDDPERISPKDVTQAFLANPLLRGYSYTVIEFDLRGKLRK